MPKEIKKHRPIIALGRKAPDGTFIITDMLCFTFPDMTDKEMATLSLKLDLWSRKYRSRECVGLLIEQ